MTKSILSTLIAIFVALGLCSCVWEDSASSPIYLPLDDSKYPYAGLPRIVIETDEYAQINDREIKHPAKLQIYGKSAPIGEVMDLTVKGRGNSSFIFAKYGIKMEFQDKVELFGMPRNRDWVLISNQRDKSLLRNYITYQLADNLDDEYSPRSHFVEVFLNRKYMGVYQLVEHMKVAKNRINIPQNDSSFWIEKTTETTTGIEKDDEGPDGEEKLFSTDKSIFISDLGYIFQINFPKEPSDYSVQLIQEHINNFETFLKSKKVYNMDSVAHWIDVEDFIRYYMIQEFSKNLDGAFRRSVHLTWEKGSVIKMGPVWDFDLGYGLGSYDKTSYDGWYVRKYGWYRFLFKSDDFKTAVKQYWAEHKQEFAALPDSVDAMVPKLSKAAKNEFKRWPVLDADDYWPFIGSYSSYEEAADTLKAWIKRRYEWIDNSLAN